MGGAWDTCCTSELVLCDRYLDPTSDGKEQYVLRTGLQWDKP